jgi:hypothetical protein
MCLVHVDKKKKQLIRSAMSSIVPPSVRNVTLPNCSGATQLEISGPSPHNDNAMPPSLLLLPHLAISLVSWMQIVLSLNRFSGVARFTRPEMVGLCIYIFTAFVRWTASLATTNASFLFQLGAASIGGMMSFTAFIIIYNDRIDIPTRQQRNSIVLVMLITALWEAVSRMLMNTDT